VVQVVASATKEHDQERLSWAFQQNEIKLEKGLFAILVANLEQKLATYKEVAGSRGKQMLSLSRTKLPSS
jgi:hypothetical protein